MEEAFTTIYQKNRWGNGSGSGSNMTIDNKKYIELLNHAYKTLTSSYEDLLDKDDYLLLPYLKTGFNRGWKVN